MYLVAYEPRSGRRLQWPLEDGEGYILGRSPEPEAVNAWPSGTPGKVLTLAIGNADRMVSRSHVWGQRQGEQLQVFRIPPEGDAVTPHPLTALISESHGGRQPLPDAIVLSPGQAFGIHREGWFEFHWVSDPDAVGPDLAGAKALDEVPSRELANDQAAGGLTQEPSAGELQQSLRTIRDDLPEVLADWSDERDLFTRVAGFLRRALPAQRQVRGAFLAVDPANPAADYRRLDRPDEAISSDEGFRASESMLREQYRGTSAVRGVPRVKLATRHRTRTTGETLNDSPSVSIDYAFDWIATVPVGSRRREAGSEVAIFQPCLHDGWPVCLYLETRESIDLAPERLLPFLSLVTSLLSSTIHGAREQKRRLASESQVAGVIAAYRGLYSPALQDVIESSGAAAVAREDPHALALGVVFDADLPLDQRAQMTALVSKHVEAEGAAVVENSAGRLIAVWRLDDGETRGDGLAEREALLAATRAVDRALVERVAVDETAAGLCFSPDPRTSRDHCLERFGANGMALRWSRRRSCRCQPRDVASRGGCLRGRCSRGCPPG